YGGKPGRLRPGGGRPAVADAIRRGQRAGAIPARTNPVDAAERLTALIEGLSERWLSGSMTVARARTLLHDAIARELDER
ncbi:TetR family transcriptional regulator C-terminal domain-containing protein, partial [Amycolatopsis sp. NPDC059021]|uniref:TetR family transcriptional regulator C-terminal domain-containing protein n=1 Tax=Amycolatopsis sp. NPDC059021 TaxID=3346704 RepID=UPI00366BBAF9